MINIYLSMLDTDEDKHSFEELYYKYRQLMYSVAYKILNNKEDSEDAVQKAFLAIANNFGKIKSLSCQEIKPFVVIIVRNHAINIYNSNKRKAEYAAEYSDIDTPVNVDYFEEFDYEELIKVISGLQPIYRDIIFLHYIRELKPKEIAKLLDISVETVWKRIERAKKQLKKALDERS